MYRERDSEFPEPSDERHLLRRAMVSYPERDRGGIRNFWVPQLDPHAYWSSRVQK